MQNVFKITAPADWAPYLLHGNAKTLFNGDQARADAFLARHNATVISTVSDKPRETANLTYYCPEVGENPRAALVMDFYAVRRS
jgi:hypothetical protein